MPALARKFAPEAETKPPPQPASERRRKVFHATVLVTRHEEWFVEAESAQEARALFTAGEGHRATSGECVHVEVERLLESAE
jgi:hypothetical protein